MPKPNHAMEPTASCTILLALLPVTRSAVAEIIVAGSTMDGNGTLKAGERVRFPYDLPYETTFLTHIAATVNASLFTPTKS
jgi:hypothetical protein